MIDMIYLAQAEELTPAVIEQRTTAIEQSGVIHSKVAGRFEVVKKLPEQAKSFDSMFDYADAYGKIRLAYINSAHKISNTPNKTEKSATSIGGEFGINSAEFYGLQMHVAAYISQGISFLNPSNNSLNGDFFSKDLDSFAYLSEASINYNSDIFQTKIGRVKVDTPYANSDDIRMAPNTFEGVWGNIDYSENLNTQLVYFNRWAGYDSQDGDSGAFQDEFKDLVSEESFGMVGASLTYEYAPDSEISFWYNYIDEMSAIAYAEIIGIYLIDGEDFHLDYGIQASIINELDNSNIDGTVYGAMGILNYKGAFIGGAYNISLSDAGKYVTNGFGGGPYYTSLDEATISAISEGAATSGNPASNNDAKAYRVGAGYEFENISIDGIVFELVYGKLYNDHGAIIEKDAILTYDMTDRWYLEATYTNYKSTCNNNTFDRALVRLDYSF